MPYLFRFSTFPEALRNAMNIFILSSACSALLVCLQALGTTYVRSESGETLPTRGRRCCEDVVNKRKKMLWRCCQQEEEDVVKMFFPCIFPIIPVWWNITNKRKNMLWRCCQQEEEDVVKMLFPCIIHIIPANKWEGKTFETYINIFWKPKTEHISSYFRADNLWHVEEFHNQNKIFSPSGSHQPKEAHNQNTT